MAPPDAGMNWYLPDRYSRVDRVALVCDGTVTMRRAFCLRVPFARVPFARVPFSCTPPPLPSPPPRQSACARKRSYSRGMCSWRGTWERSTAAGRFIGERMEPALARLLQLVAAPRGCMGLLMAILQLGVRVFGGES